MSRWIMNIPIDPTKKKDLKNWLKDRHPDATKDEIDGYIDEWNALMEGKTLGLPASADKTSEEYQEMGWFGVYEP